MLFASEASPPRIAAAEAPEADDAQLPPLRIPGGAVPLPPAHPFDLGSNRAFVFAALAPSSSARLVAEAPALTSCERRARACLFRARSPAAQAADDRRSRACGETARGSIVFKAVISMDAARPVRRIHPALDDNLLRKISNQLKLASMNNPALLHCLGRRPPFRRVSLGSHLGGEGLRVFFRRKSRVTH